ncbi:MAG TPA: hypothetical protein VHM30_11585 [Gemmatimonadaceae bacterium]|nr:hypothetical protein [Gemmatimonadaceae bacterium]
MSARVAWIRRARAAAAAILLVAAPRVAHTQERILVQGILDIEGWSTDSASRLLARNEGRASGLARLCVWSAFEPVSGVVAYLQMEVAGGSALEEGTEVGIEQGGLRYTRSRALVVDAGMIAPIVGMYANRHLSTRNPLIGEPDGYVVAYPLGVRVSGKTETLDYRIGVISLPVYNERYMPEPTATPHIAAGAGVTPHPGVRVGVSGTIGPWLDDATPAAALDGRSWRGYEQRVAAADAEWSVGYLDLRGELAHAWHEVPGHSKMVHGTSWYGEGSYAFTPRVFAALRVERNDYPYLKPVGTRWPARSMVVGNGEVGAGYRLAAGQALKVSYRRDRWGVPSAGGRQLPDGHALAVQLSTAFDLLDLIASARGR